MMLTAVFDTETKTIEASPYDAELSAICIIFSDDGEPRYYSGDDDTLAEGVDALMRADRLCGFNSWRFDIPVILKYMDRGHGRKLRAKPHLDFYHEYTMQRRGQRISLANMSKSTLGEQWTKMDMWNDTAISLYKTNPTKLRQYNIYDTSVTYGLLLYLYTHGYVWYTAPTRQKMHIPNWAPVLYTG